MREHVVKIFDKEEHAIGTGLLLDSHVATVDHILTGEDKYTVQTSCGKFYDAEVVFRGREAGSDTATLSVAIQNDVKHNMMKPTIGDGFKMHGFPFRNRAFLKKGREVSGRVVAFNLLERADNYAYEGEYITIRGEEDITEGFSGSPVFVKEALIGLIARKQPGEEADVVNIVPIESYLHIDGGKYSHLFGVYFKDPGAYDHWMRHTADWERYWGKLIVRTKESIRWFEEEERMTIANMFLPKQQLRWRSQSVESTSEFEDPDKYQTANCLDKLLLEIDALQEGHRKRCICVSATSGHGLTTLAKMLCGKLAEKKRHVLHIDMRHAPVEENQMIKDMIRACFVTRDEDADFHEMPRALDDQSLVIAFDGFHYLMQMKRNGFFEALDEYLKENPKTIALLFLNKGSMNRAHDALNDVLQEYELMDFDEKHGAKDLRDEWCEKCAKYTKNPFDAKRILSLLKQDENVNLFQRMVHPTVCALVCRFFSSDPSSLPQIKSNRISTELFDKIVAKVLADKGLPTDDDLRKERLPRMAHELWQNQQLATFSQEEEYKARLKKLCFFAMEEPEEYRFYDCFRDYFCAQYVCNILGSDSLTCNTAYWMNEFGAQQANEDLLDFMYSIVQSQGDEWCEEAQGKLAKLLGTRLKNGWQWEKGNISTEKMLIFAANADTMLLAALSSLGYKTQKPAPVLLSDRECANRWISQLAGGSASLYLNDAQGLRYINWIHFTTESNSPIIIDAAFFSGNNFIGMEKFGERKAIEWVLPRYLESYMDANNGYVRKIIEQQDSVIRHLGTVVDTKDLADDHKGIDPYHCLSRKMRYQFERKPARLECFEPTMSTFDIDSLINKLACLYHPTIRILGRPNSMVSSDIALLEKVFLRLFNNAEKYNILTLPVYVEIEKNANEVRVTVKNYTINIDKADEKKLKNYRFRAPNYLGQVGSGEGLWYCAQAAEALGMKLSIGCEEIEGLNGYDLAGIICYGHTCYDKDGHVIEEESKIVNEELNEQLTIRNEADREKCISEKVFDVYQQLEKIIGTEDYSVLKKAVMHMKARSAGMRLALPGTSRFCASIELPMTNKENCNA